jgi:hypothetical protein
MKRWSVALILVFLLPFDAGAQSEAESRTVSSSRLLITRGELLENLQWHQDRMARKPKDKKIREESTEAIAYIQRRLEEGDFRPGDQIGLYVEGELEFPDTLIVETGPSVLLPNIGTVPLRGVLRSELQDHLTRELERYIKDPVVRVWPTIRVGVLGSVGRQGFYTFPATLPLGDAIMEAGPGGEADMEKITVERNDEELLDEEVVQTAIADGRSFDQLGLRPGDEIVIPAKPQIWSYVLRWGVPILSILVLGVRVGY